MRKNYLSGTIVLLLAFALSLAGCNDGTTSGNQTTPSGTSPGTTPLPDPKNLSPALRAVPTASGTASSPKVLDSYTDGTKNYYLIDVGYVRNMFVSTVLQAAYNGMTPISVAKTTITDRTITEVLTETIAETIVVSDTQNYNVGIEGAWEKKFPVAGKFSAKLKFEWTGSWTNSETSSKSRETSVSKTESIAESYTTSVTIGEHGEPAGNYRYALYAVCDTYFILSTSPDNQNLLSWDTFVCARDSTYTPHWDYSPDGTFDNSPDGKAITFSDDFYKNLTKPISTIPSDTNPTTITTEFVNIRSDTKKITDSGRFNQHMDVINFSSFEIELNALKQKINLNTLKQQGYKTVSFYIQLNVREIDDGYQKILLFSSPTKSNDYLLAEKQFEHSPGKKDTNWWVHHESELKFENMSIDKFPNNEFVIRYSADGKWGDSWENKDLKIQLVVKK